ncbi:MAG TPA: hypothetical protein VGV85_18110 [Longimicrobiaceae bacterium]|nr:hypothetical protein [Longimicrobiaceae bacterium]
MIEPPVSRRLRILAFDPSLATRLDTATINEITLHVPWEEDLCPGPVGEYVEVVDCDPASGVVYRPVDLNDRHVLAQDGLPPSESDPQFHQQMVYAVAMTTIRHFERALGRVAFWADHRIRTDRGEFRTQFVRRLRIYPHAVRDRNAYYSPTRKALLFGYFPVAARDEHNAPGTLVFTCLSHDVVAHEVTHALLDGVHPRFNEPSNPDVHAFHEAFADIVALFQHFSYPAVLESQIRRTRGDLHTESLLAQLAHQFGRATGRGSALRDALGETDPDTGAWKPRRPDPHALEKAREPHARGSVLVAAVFRAFLLIYRARTADLFRIATQGTGTLPAGDIHPDLAQRLAAEAAKCAERVLQMCIRAIDYCPPVDVTFGDFLRGVITADLDYAPEDPAGFRIVFIQSFREWGIYPRGVTSLGVDALVWPRGDDLLQDLRGEIPAGATGADVRGNLKEFVVSATRDWNLESNRYRVWKALAPVRAKLREWLHDSDSMGRHYAKLFGLVVDRTAPRTVSRNGRGEPAVEVHAVRPTLRRTVSGVTRTDLVIEVTQRRLGYFDPAVQERVDRGESSPDDWPHDFVHRAGCTILVDTRTAEVRRVIRTAGPIDDDEELDRVRRFHAGESGAAGNAFDAGLAGSLARLGVTRRDEPFAMLHRMEED